MWSPGRRAWMFRIRIKNTPYTCGARTCYAAVQHCAADLLQVMAWTPGMGSSHSWRHTRTCLLRPSSSCWLRSCCRQSSCSGTCAPTSCTRWGHGVLQEASVGISRNTPLADLYPSKVQQFRKHHCPPCIAIETSFPAVPGAVPGLLAFGPISTCVCNGRHRRAPHAAGTPRPGWPRR